MQVQEQGVMEHDLRWYKQGKKQYETTDEGSDRGDAEIKALGERLSCLWHHPQNEKKQKNTVQNYSLISTASPESWMVGVLALSSQGEAGQAMD